MGLPITTTCCGVSNDELEGFNNDIGLSEEQLAMLYKFYKEYTGELRAFVDKKRETIFEKTNSEFLKTDFKIFVTARMKKFGRTLNKIVKKCNKDNDSFKSLCDSMDYDGFKKMIRKKVLDFVGFRVISVPKSFDVDVESLDQKIKSFSPNEFLTYFFRLSTTNDAFFENDVLYTIRDFLYLNLSEEFELNGDDNKGFDAIPKDYVEEPKSSGYRGIQFNCPFEQEKGKNEIQIRNFMQHIYAEYEHRRYEGKIEPDELVPLYLACEICSMSFKDPNIRKMELSGVLQIYSICLSALRYISTDNVYTNYQCDLQDLCIDYYNGIDEDITQKCRSIALKVNAQLKEQNLMNDLSEEDIEDFFSGLHNKNFCLYYVKKLG